MGIDQSYTNTAFVFLDDDKELVSYGVISTSKDFDKIERARDIANQLADQALSHKPKKIAIEGLAFGAKGDATRDLGGLLFIIIDRLLYTHGFEVVVVAPNTVKKHATDNGRAAKEEMFERLPESVQSSFKPIPKTKGRLDLTDAYWLADIITP